MAEPDPSSGVLWSHYLAEHRRPDTRALHTIGTILAMVCIALAAAGAA